MMWFMIKRIANLVAHDSPFLGCIVEIGEIYAGGKENNKDRRTMNLGKDTGDKTAILGMIERGGDVALRKFGKICKVDIAPHIKAHIAPPDAVANIDESPIYKGTCVSRKRRQVNHNAGFYGIGTDTTNQIESIFLHLKRMVNKLHIWHSCAHIKRVAAFMTRSEGNRIEWREVIV